MIVVADSSPINYLVLIEHVHLLPDLFGEVVLPEAVAAELRSTKAPTLVRDWMREVPRWIRFSDVTDDKLQSLSEPDLHLGEREAIALAQLLEADYLIMDEKAGRRAALRRKLSVIGTLGVLEKADTEGMLTDFPKVLERLDGTNFYISDDLKETLLRRHRDRAEQ